MAKKIIPQFQWTTGEVDPINFKRTDVPFYLSAAQKLLNLWIGTTGLIRKRNGFNVLSDVSKYASHNSALFELADKFNNRYVQMASPFVFDIFLQDGTFWQSLVTPYGPSDLSTIDSTLNNDVLIMAHPNYPPARTFVSEYEFPDPPVWEYQVLNIDPYPSFDFATINYNDFVVLLTAPTDTTIQLRFGPLSTDPGYTTEWIGGQIIGAGNSANDPLGYASITAVTPWSSGSHYVTFVGTVQIAFNTSAPATVGSQYSIRQPAWSNTLGWPSKVLYYQNRLWFANTKSLEGTLFASSINSPINFDVGVGNDSDAIVYSLGQNDSGPIFGLNGGKQLEIYTQNFEFAAPQNQEVGLTPSTFSIRQQSAYGSSPDCKPLTYVNDSYFISKTGNSIINYHFDGVGLSYTSTNVSQASLHLVKNPTNRAIVKGSLNTQDNYIFYLNPDSTITTFQFAHETNLAALTPMDFNTQVDSNGNPINSVGIIDIVTIGNTLYVLKYLGGGGDNNMITENNNIMLTDNNFTMITDISVTAYTLEAMQEDTKLDSVQTVFMDSTGLIKGIYLFIGFTIQVLYNGQNLGSYVVQDAEDIMVTEDDAYEMETQNVNLMESEDSDSGEVIVDNPNGYSGNVQIGLLYYDNFTLMYNFTGVTETDYFKNVSRIFVDYNNSLGFNINGKLVPFQNYNQIQAGLPLTPQSGTSITNIVNGWNRYGTITIDQNSPYDLQILGLRYEIDSAYR